MAEKDDSIVQAETGENGDSSALETGDIRAEEYKVGPGKPPLHTRFTSKNQPDHKKSGATRKKKSFDRKMLKEMLNLPYKFQLGSQIEGQLKAAYGASFVEKNMTVMQIATLIQMNKAILRGDTQAFTNLMIQAFGHPNQKTELTGAGGSPLNQVATINVISVDKVPEIKENEDDV